MTLLQSTEKRRKVHETVKPDSNAGCISDRAVDLVQVGLVCSNSGVTSSLKTRVNRECVIQSGRLDASGIADMINLLLRYNGTVYTGDFGRPCTDFIYDPTEKSTEYSEEL